MVNYFKYGLFLLLMIQEVDPANNLYRYGEMSEKKLYYTENYDYILKFLEEHKK